MCYFLWYLIHSFFQFFLTGLVAFLEGNIAHVQSKVGFDHVGLHVLEELLFYCL